MWIVSGFFTSFFVQVGDSINSPNLYYDVTVFNSKLDNICKWNHKCQFGKC